MSEEKWSLQEIADKAEWEGGLEALAYWGLKPKDIEDQEVAGLWSQFLWALEELKSRLPEPGDEEV